MLPSLKGYTAEEQLGAYAEMTGGQCPHLSMFTSDYGVMRDEVRVAKGLPVPPEPVTLPKPVRKPERPHSGL